MLDDFRDWVIKHGTVSVLFAGTPEDLSHHVRSLTPLMPPCCKKTQSSVGRWHTDTLVNTSNYSYRPKSATSKNMRHMSETASWWFPQLSTLPSWSYKCCGYRQAIPLWTLSKFLTHRVCEHSKFRDDLLPKLKHSNFRYTGFTPLKMKTII